MGLIPVIYPIIEEEDGTMESFLIPDKVKIVFDPMGPMIETFPIVNSSEADIIKLILFLQEKFGPSGETEQTREKLTKTLGNWNLLGEKTISNWIIDALRAVFNVAPSGPNSFTWFEDGTSKNWPLIFMNLNPWINCEMESGGFPRKIQFGDEVRLIFEIQEGKGWTWEVTTAGLKTSPN